MGTGHETHAAPAAGEGYDYDDFADLLARRGAHLDLALCADLVDRLAVYDVTYLGGGSADAGRSAPYRGPTDVDLERLLRDLARAPEPRLRDALIALLLRHPDHALTVRALLLSPTLDAPTRASLTARLLAAAALQRIHYPGLAQDLPNSPLIDVADLAAAQGLPRPEDAKDGRALLQAAQRMVAGRHPWIAYMDGWEDVARHTLRELHWQAAGRAPALRVE